MSSKYKILNLLTAYVVLLMEMCENPNRASRYYQFEEIGER